MKKLLAIITSIVLCISLVGCGSTGNTDIAKDAIVMTIGDNEITASDFASYVKNNKTSYQMYYQNSYGDADVSALWQDTELCSMIIDNAKSQLIYDLAVSEMAKDLGLELTEANMSDIATTKQSYIDQLGSEEAFNEYINEMGFNSEKFDKLLEIAQYQSLFSDYYYGENGKTPVTEQNIVDYFNNNYYRAKHILIKTVDDSNQALSDEEIAAKTELANEALAKVKAGEDFDSLIKQYGEDPGMTAHPDGYTFSSDDSLVEEFISGTSSLEINQTSELITSSYGYHIIQRLPLNQDALYDEAGSFSGNCIYDIIESSLKNVDQLVNDYINNSLKISINEDNYAKISVPNIDNLLSI